MKTLGEEVTINRDEGAAARHRALGACTLRTTGTRGRVPNWGWMLGTARGLSMQVNRA